MKTKAQAIAYRQVTPTPTIHAVQVTATKPVKASVVRSINAAPPTMTANQNRQKAAAEPSKARVKRRAKPANVKAGTTERRVKMVKKDCLNTSAPSVLGVGLVTHSSYWISVK